MLDNPKFIMFIMASMLGTAFIGGVATTLQDPGMSSFGAWDLLWSSIKSGADIVPNWVASPWSYLTLIITLPIKVAFIGCAWKAAKSMIPFIG